MLHELSMTKPKKPRAIAPKSSPHASAVRSLGGTPQSMTGGAAIVAQLIANGVDSVFGLPGAQMYPFFDALQQNAGAIRTYGARHEQATAYMAFGYARSTGKPGVCSVVPGPGVLNASAALATAMGASTPVLCITGQVPSQFIGRGRGHLHELPDQLATVRSLFKWAARIERPADAPAVINEAFRQMLSGRPGVVCIEMAWDLMASAEDVVVLPAAELAPLHAPAVSAIDAAARLLQSAKHPLIFTGTGAQHASAEVLALAEILDAPVVAFRGGRGVVAEDHPLGISAAVARELWPECDVVLGIGTRLELPYMRWTGMMTLIDKPAAPPHLIRIDIDPAEMGRLIPHVAVVADAALGTVALRGAIVTLASYSNAAAATRTKRRAHIAGVRSVTRKAIDKVQPEIGYLDVIRECLPRDGFLVEELCQAGFAAAYGFPIYQPRTFVSCGFQGTLGFGFPTALGVKAAHPDRAVVSITGDGGFQFGLQELATARQENIALVVVLFNNASYGNVMRDQRERFGNRIIGAALENPDFQLLAQAYGIDSVQVTSPEQLRPALQRALAASKPALIEVVIAQGSEASPWAFLGPGYLAK